MKPKSVVAAAPGSRPSLVGSDFDDYEDDLDPELYDENGNLYPECGMDSHGQCSMAGSEDCDECPEMDALIRRNQRTAEPGAASNPGKSA